KDEVIGMFSKTVENDVLDTYTAKSITITQCTNAQLSDASHNTSPVVDITSTKKLTIISPDTVGGTIGWYIENGSHDLKSIRANNATDAGVRIKAGANTNSVSWNNISGNGIGLDVLSNTNTLKGGTVGPNSGVGVHFGSAATGNTLSGATIQGNT